MSNRSQCVECGRTIDLTVDVFHSDDSGDMHSDCFDTYVERSSREALGWYRNRYLKQSREQVQLAADCASHYRYGDREGDF